MVYDINFFFKFSNKVLIVYDHTIEHRSLYHKFTTPKYRIRVLYINVSCQKYLQELDITWIVRLGGLNSGQDIFLKKS